MPVRNARAAVQEQQRGQGQGAGAYAYVLPAAVYLDVLSKIQGVGLHAQPSPNSAATSRSSSRTLRCWGHASSHWPQPMQSLGPEPFLVSSA